MTQNRITWSVLGLSVSAGFIGGFVGFQLLSIPRVAQVSPPVSVVDSFTPTTNTTGVGIKEYETEYAKKWEANKAKWLKENPPVEFLFDIDRRMDKDYVLYYLKNNRISGDCALVFIADVVCWSEDDQLQFPTERPDLDKQ